MISILAQERLLGFALGSVSMSGFVLHQRRSIYRSLADADAAAGSSFSYQPSEITGGRSSTDLAHVWNKAVDETLGRLVVYLSSRGWLNRTIVLDGSMTYLSRTMSLLLQIVPLNWDLDVT